MTKAKFWCSVCLFMGFAGVLYSAVVINEIMYDPVGTDTGYEWIELYNNGTTDINLQGARIQVGGSIFTTVFTFPHYILRAKRFVLIGETNVTQAIFLTPLVMQNGGTETDGVRFISADGTYTDTVLYDSPNTNNLPDDTGMPGSSFAPDVPAGYSLARIADGYDTNNCETDFIFESNPTPGLPNRFSIDYALTGTNLQINGINYSLNTEIVNNSLADSDTLTITLKVSLNNQLLHSFIIQPIEFGTGIPFTSPISVNINSGGLLKVELHVYNDVNPADNVWTMQLGDILEGPVYINEILYNPDTGNQEWIELYIPPQVSCFANITIHDAANNSAAITLPSLCPEYLVLCRNQALLLTRYPDCPPANVLQVSSLPVLNNEGDIIILKDGNGVTIDSMSYIGVASKKDYSLERYVASDNTISWHYSYASAKGTPGLANSEPPPPSELGLGKVKIIGSPFNPLAAESMKLQYSFVDASNTINCELFDLKGRKVHTIVSGMSVGNSGEISWNGKDNSGKAFPRGIYVLLVEAKNSSKHYFLRKQLTVVLATK